MYWNRPSVGCPGGGNIMVLEGAPGGAPVKGGKAPFIKITF